MSRAAFRRLDPRVKIILVAALVVAVASVPVNLSALPVVGLVCFWWFLSRTPLKRAAKTVATVLPFAMVAALSLPWIVVGRPLFSLDLGPWLLTMSHEGVVSAAEVVARAVLAALTLAALVGSTPFEKLTEGLCGLRVPAPLVLTLCTMHRYIPVLGHEAASMVRAARARGGARGGGFFAVGALVASLLIRALDRADRVHRAMESRGFDGTVPERECSHLGLRDMAWLFGGAGTISVSVLFSLLTGV